MRIRIVKTDGEHARKTQVTDADTGETLDDVKAYAIKASVDDTVVYADLTRYETPKRIDQKTGKAPEYVDRVEVVAIDTEAETGEAE